MAPKTTQAWRRAANRETDLINMARQGATFTAMGEKYGISKQRVKQILKRLASEGVDVAATQVVRTELRVAAIKQRMQEKYGDLHTLTAEDPVVFSYLRRRITSKRAAAKNVGIPFSLTVSDLFPLPTHCPVLGIPIMYSSDAEDWHRDHTLSIDRVIPELGYVPGNIALISMRANRIKNDATLEELQKVAAYYTALNDTKLTNNS